MNWCVAQRRAITLELCGLTVLDGNILTALPFWISLVSQRCRDTISLTCSSVARSARCSPAAQTAPARHSPTNPRALPQSPRASETLAPARLSCPVGTAAPARPTFPRGRTGVNTRATLGRRTGCRLAPRRLRFRASLEGTPMGLGLLRELAGLRC